MPKEEANKFLKRLVEDQNFRKKYAEKIKEATMAVAKEAGIHCSAEELEQVIGGVEKMYSDPWTQKTPDGPIIHRRHT